MDRDDRPLAPRKRPVQERAKERIQRLLDATETLIRAGGPTALTTPAVATEAGVPVGSIYQYFPNKESLVLALYERKFEQIRDFAEESFADAEPDWRVFFRSWVHRLRREEARIDYDISLNRAIDHFPRLADVSRAHTDRMAKLVVDLLKHFGSTWPDEALFDLAIYAVYLNSASWLYWAYAGEPLPQGVDRLGDTLIALFTPAFEGEPPPSPYARARESIVQT